MRQKWWKELCGITAGLLVVGHAAEAQSGLFLNRDRGFQPERLQTTANFDTINTFNGNLVFTLPVGNQYPLSEDFSFGLSLVYNSNVWDHDVVFPNVFPPQEASRMSPGEHFNAGLGFSVSLGSILLNQSPGGAPYTYRAPDGSEHTFSDRLHIDVTSTSPDVYYTTDGSYLRLKRLASGWRLEFPDGKVHTFNSYGLPIEITDQKGLLNPTEITANRITISYQPETTSQPILWTIRDQFNRTHTVHFQTAIDNRYIVNRIELEAFGSQPKLVYRFSYNEDHSIQRGCPHNEPPISQGGGVDPTAAVSLLTKVCAYDSPENTTTPFACYSMEGAGDYDLGTVPNTCTSGVLKALTLPTVGKIEWDYGSYRFPVPVDCAGTPRGRVWLAANPGVIKRRLRDVNGLVAGEWTYQPQLDSIFSGCNTNPPPRYLTNTVTDPLGNTTEYFYSVSLEDGSGWRAGEYGAPISRHASDDNGRFLSERYRDAAGVVKREIYRTFDWDASDQPQSASLNRRMMSERISYVDQNRREDLDLSVFDGFGNFRNRVTDGNFGAGGVGDPDADNDRTIFTNYNLAMGSYPGPSHVSWPTTREWVLGNYTEVSVTGMGATAKTVACFEAATGWLMWKRTFVASSAPGSTDVLVRYSRDMAGNVTAEHHHGGDAGGLASTGTSATCAIAPGTATYQISHTYQHGVRNSSQFQGANFKTLDHTIDLRTGLPSSSRDSAGLQTTYSYDALGRLKTADTPGAASSRYTYFPAIGTSQKARVDIEYLQASGSSTVLAFERVRWEAFGRIHAYDRRMPGGALSSKQFRYNALGWKTWESEQGSTVQGSTFMNHDLFGRPARIRPADGSAHDVQFWYAGARDLTRRVRVALDPSGAETEVRTTETYNRQGRLWKVTENSGSSADNTNLETEYVYDVGGRLTRVEMDRTSRGQGVQARYFCYDNRGFLKREKMPEKAATGDCATVTPGSVTHDSYDALGNVGRKTDGPNDLRYVYDLAGRLTKIESLSTGQLLKQFTYGSGTTSTDRSKGKIKTAERYNYVILGVDTLYPVPYTALVRETYTYGGVAGKISSKTTELILTSPTTSYTSDVFTQSYQYDALGQVTQIGYPMRCTTCSPNTSGTASRTVDFAYTNGFLSSVPGYAGSIAYHGSGMLESVQHSNGVLESAMLDASAIGRPSAIGTSNVAAGLNWSSGTIAYDGAGNIKSMGGSVFRYDAYGRLAFGQVATGRDGFGLTHWQQFGYDDFGNLKTIGGSSSTFSRNVPVSSATNRLSGALNLYDAVGNLTHWNGVQQYTYDAFNQPWRVVINGVEEWIHLYTADDERLFSYLLSGSPGGDLTRYTLRDLDGKVLRELSLDRASGVFTISRDYIYRNGKLLAAEVPENRYHYHLDHLGTPRQITNSGAQEVGFHTYMPFGEEITSSTQNSERAKFTGHERDLHAAGNGDELDYMHARYYNPFQGRFMSIDPLDSSAQPTRPQSWNRYGYSRANPINRLDPDGRADIAVTWGLEAITPIGSGGVAIGIVVDLDDPLDSGILYSKSEGVGGGVEFEAPKAKGFDIGTGWTVEVTKTEAEGTNVNHGVHLGPVSGGTTIEDGKIVGFFVEPGAKAGIGSTVSRTTADSLTLRDGVDYTNKKVDEAQTFWGRLKLQIGRLAGPLFASPAK